MNLWRHKTAKRTKEKERTSWVDKYAIGERTREKKQAKYKWAHRSVANEIEMESQKGGKESQWNLTREKSKSKSTAATACGVEGAAAGNAPAEELLKLVATTHCVVNKAKSQQRSRSCQRVAQMTMHHAMQYWRCA